MQTSSCILLLYVFYVLLFKELNSTKIKNNHTFARNTRHLNTRKYRDIKDDKDDIEVRAILIRCPQQKENEVFHSNPKSISNISSLRAEAILQFPGYDSDETTYQSNIAKCRKKIVISLRIRNAGKKSLEVQHIVVDHVFDQLTGKNARLLNAYVLKIKQDPSFEMYGLKFTNVVNGETTEEVITKSTSNYTGCDDSSDHPTCGFAFYKDERVPYSQGFCCSCDAGVNAERQPSCHHTTHNESLNGWKPDESFRQPDKPFEKSKTISLSKIQMVKEDSSETQCGGEASQNRSSCHQNVDKKTQKPGSKVKGAIRGNVRHHSGEKVLKSTTCERHKSSCEPTRTTHSCTKLHEKKTWLEPGTPGVASSKSNFICDASTRDNTSLNLETDNHSQYAPSEKTALVDAGLTTPKVNFSESKETAPNNFPVSTRSTSLPTTTVFLASEMYTVSLDVTKESANSVIEKPSTTSPPQQLGQEKYKTVEEVKVHSTTGMGHSDNSTCSVTPSPPKYLLKKYQNFMPEDKSNATIVTLTKCHKTKSNKTLPPTKDSHQKKKSFGHFKENPSKIANSGKGCKCSNERHAFNSTTCSPKNENTKENSIKTISAAEGVDQLATEKNINSKMPLVNDESQLTFQDDIGSVSTKEKPSISENSAEQPVEMGACMPCESVLAEPEVANVKWLGVSLIEAETTSKFTPDSPLDLSGLYLKVNNLHDEPLEFSTQTFLDSVQVSDADNIFAGIKSDLQGKEYVPPNDFAVLGGETSFKKKEIISKDIQKILAEAKTVSTLLKNYSDFDIDQINDVGLTSQPLTKTSEYSKRLTQDEINEILLASNQELEIEPRLSRKRRKGARRENCEDDKSESGDASCNSMKISDSTEFSCAKKTSQHLTQHPHTQYNTTQKHTSTTKPPPKKHAKKHGACKTKTTTHHANCTKYPVGPCLTACDAATTESFEHIEKHDGAAESIKRTSDVVGIQNSELSQILQANKEKISGSESNEFRKNNDELKKVFSGKGVKKNRASSKRRIIGHANAPEIVLGNAKPHKNAGTSPYGYDGNFLPSLNGNEGSAASIKNASPVLQATRSSQQVDLVAAQAKHRKNKVGFEFSDGFGGSDANSGAFEYTPHREPSKSSLAGNSLKQKAFDVAFDDSILTVENKPLARISQRNGDLFKQYVGRNKRFPRTRDDYLNQLERRRYEVNDRPGKTIVKREVESQNSDEMAMFVIPGDQQGKTVISGGKNKLEKGIAGTKNTSCSNSSLTERKQSEQQHKHSMFYHGKTNIPGEQKHLDADDEEMKEKDIKNCTKYVKINPLSQMPSVTTKLDSLNKALNRTVSNSRLVISPSDVRSKSHPESGSAPDTPEEKLSAILKEFKQKLLPLIEDAEDKKIIDAKEKSKRHKKRDSRSNFDKRLEKTKSRITRSGDLVTSGKHSGPIINKPVLARECELENGTDIKRSVDVARIETPSLDEEVASDKVGYVPHYITDQVPMEKAKVLDYKNCKKHKDRGKSRSAVLKDAPSDAHDFEQDGNSKESPSKERIKRNESEKPYFLELLEAIEADSINKHNMEEILAIDNINVGIDTPIYDSSNNIFENDYASFVEDDKNEESNDIGCFYCDKKIKKKRAVSKESQSFSPGVSKESDYSVKANVLDMDKELQDKKMFEENRIKRNPHGGVRKNHLKIPIPRPRDDKGHTNKFNQHQIKEKREKIFNTVHKSNEFSDNDYMTLRFDVDDENGISQLEYGEEFGGDYNTHPVDSSKDGDRQKRQVLASGHQCRGGQNCADRSTPANVNPKTYHESAHCLRFSDLWYAVYKVDEPEIVHTIYVQIFEKRTDENGSTHWQDHTHGKMISLSSSNPKPPDLLPLLSMEYHSLDDCTGPFSLNASKLRLLVPQPVCKEKMGMYPQLQGGPGEYLLLDENLVSADGETCDVAGVAYEGFARQDNRCGRPRGSCLKNQPVQFWRDDIQARMAKRKGRYFLENFATVPSNPIKTDKNDEQFLALESRQKQESFVSIELNADFNSIIRVGSTVQITEIHVDSTTPGKNILSILMTNTGLATGRYRTRVTDCALEAPKEWSTVEGHLLSISPQRDARTEMILKGDLPVESIHCSAEVVNNERELVATRRFRVQLNDRCLCVWWCLCACIGTVDGLKCRPHSQQHHLAAGFQGGVPVSAEPAGFHLSAAGLSDMTEDLKSTICMVLCIILLIILLLGLTKAIIGLFCVPVVGAWGIYALVFRPIRLKAYYEPELEEEEVVYDQEGFPVNPVSGYHNVRMMSNPLQFLYNVAFFLLVLPALTCKCVLWCCCSVPRSRPNDDLQQGCDDNMCFDSYPNDDAREEHATNYVLMEMEKNNRHVVTSYVDMVGESTPLMRAASEPKMHPSVKRNQSKAEKMARSLVKQKTTFRNLKEPIFGVEFPRDIPYCIRGIFTKEATGFRWIPNGNPLLQYWTFDGDLKFLKRPRVLEAKRFELWYATPQEIYSDRVLSKLPKGFCINVKFQDDVSILGDEDPINCR